MSVIETILATATFAPSAHNRQPWRFAVITTQAVKEILPTPWLLISSAIWLETVFPLKKYKPKSHARRTVLPQLLSPFSYALDMSEMDSYPDAKRSQAERIMAVQSAAAAGLQLLLAAHAEGLGGVWACWPLFAQESIRNTLDIAETWEPQAMFFIGYPDETARNKKMKDLVSIVKVI